MTVDEPIDDAARKGKKGRAGVMSVAERLQSHAQLSPNSQADGEGESAKNTELNLGGYDKATIRIIAQYLDTIGLQGSVEALVEETGVTIETSAGARIRHSILKGNYDAACNILKDSRDLPPEVSENASYIVQCFKLADFVRKGRYFDALFTMQSMSEDVINDSQKNQDFFNSFMRDVLLGGSRYTNVEAADSRDSQLAFLEGLLPHDFILPQNRLKTLLQKMHGPGVDEKSLKLLRDEEETGHKCRPWKSVQVLEHHMHPVYVVKFSRCGKLMASGGKSNNITLYRATKGRLHRIGDFAATVEGDVGYMEFCPKSKYLAVCGGVSNKNNLTIFDVKTRRVYRTLRVHGGHDDIIEVGSIFTCCSFLYSPVSHYIVAGNELGALKVFNLLGREDALPIKQVSGFRVRCIYGMKDGERFLTVDTHNRVRMYRLGGEMGGQTICQEDKTIMSMVVHPSERLILTTTEVNLHLWDIRSHTLVRVFSGACQKEEFVRYSIHSTFGGVHQNFIATGTIGKENEKFFKFHNQKPKKDGRVVLWSVSEGHPKYILVGHRGHVNAVTWNPKDPTMIVSCGDDSTVRVWSLDRAETSEYVNIVPRMIPRRVKSGMPLENDPHCETTTRTSELCRNMKEKLRMKEFKWGSGFEEDLEKEKEWIARSRNPLWTATKDD